MHLFKTTHGVPEFSLDPSIPKRKKREPPPNRTHYLHRSHRISESYSIARRISNIYHKEGSQKERSPPRPPKIIRKKKDIKTSEGMRLLKRTPGTPEFSLNVWIPKRKKRMQGSPRTKTHRYLDLSPISWFPKKERKIDEKTRPRYPAPLSA